MDWKTSRKTGFRIWQYQKQKSTVSWKRVEFQKHFLKKWAENNQISLMRFIEWLCILLSTAWHFSFDESTESVTLLDSDSDLSLNCLDADPSDDDEDDATNEKKNNLCKMASSHWRTPLIKLRNLFHFIQAFSKRKIKWRVIFSEVCQICFWAVEFWINYLKDWKSEQIKGLNSWRL